MLGEERDHVLTEGSMLPSCTPVTRLINARHMGTSVQLRHIVPVLIIAHWYLYAIVKITFGDA